MKRHLNLKAIKVFIYSTWWLLRFYNLKWRRGRRTTTAGIRTEGWYWRQGGRRRSEAAYPPLERDKNAKDDEKADKTDKLDTQFAGNNIYWKESSDKLHSLSSYCGRRKTGRKGRTYFIVLICPDGPDPTTLPCSTVEIYFYYCRRMVCAVHAWAPSGPVTRFHDTTKRNSCKLPHHHMNN